MVVDTATPTEGMNAFVRSAGEKKKLDALVAPLRARIEALEARVKELESKQTTKAPKGKE